MDVELLTSLSCCFCISVSVFVDVFSRMASLLSELNRLGQNLLSCGDVGFVNMYKGLLPNQCVSSLF